MKDYTTYEPKDFLEDDSFLKWLKNGKKTTGEEGAFWSDWITKNPSKKETVAKAEEIYLVLTELPEKDMLENSKNEIWNRIDTSIKELDANLEVTPQREKKVFRLKVWSVAATISLLIALGVFMSPWSNNKGVPLNDIIVENGSQKSMTVALSDGSSIKLFPGATISYPEIFKGKYRQVTTTGKAFFEIAKRENLPFIVYSKHFTTKVLGTSFLINDGKSKGEANISVVRGRVEVFGNEEEDEAIKEDNVTGTIVRDQEKIRYNEDGASFLKEQYHENIADAFIFKNTPVRNVLDQLKQFYGIEVMVSEENLTNCFFNASLVDIPLMEKISLLCSAMGYEYVFENNTLTLTGSGCN